jgi:hypothetical protein
MLAKHNPFRTEQVLRVRYRLSGTTWEDLLTRLAALDCRAAILGPEGSGKTTLLEDLAPRLRARGLRPRQVRLRATERSFPRGFLRRLFAEVTQGDVILFDGADHLRWLAWRRFLRRSRAAGGLVVTSHGAPLLPPLIECSTSVELLEGIVEELLGAEAIVLRPRLPDLFQRHRGNLREVLREAYDLYAGRCDCARIG